MPDSIEDSALGGDKESYERSELFPMRINGPDGTITEIHSAHELMEYAEEVNSREARQ